jgi:hypothetical protein
MLSDELEVLLRAEMHANQAIEWLLDRLFNDEEPDDALAVLKEIAERFDDDTPNRLETIAHYRGMRSSLDEQDFIWGASQNLKPSVLRMLRHSRRRQYLQYLEMFELNVQLTLVGRKSSMALSSDWSALDKYISDGALMLKCRLQLRYAAELFRWSRPGALDRCDGAVFAILRLVYLRQSPSAA